MQPISYTLTTPVEHDGQTYTELTLVQCKAKHLAATDGLNGTMKAIALYAAMAGVPRAVVEDVSAEDFGELAVATAPLMGKGAAAAVKDALSAASEDASAE